MILLLLACNRGDDGVSGDVDNSDSASASDSGDTGEPLDFSALPESCEEATDLGTDPLVYQRGLQISQEEGEGPGGFFIEIVDMEKNGDVIYTAGQGGLVAFDLSVDGTVTEAGVWPPGRNSSGRYHRVEHIGDDVVAVVHREDVIEFVDMSDPGDPTFLTAQNGWGREGLAAVGDRLYVSDRSDGGRLQIWDISDVSNPTELTILSDFPGNTWELAASDDGWLYAADQSEGLVPIALDDPDVPSVGQAVDLGMVLHADVDGDWIYAALGSNGVAVLDRSDPAAPSLVTTLPVAGSAVQVAADGGFLFAADHEGLMAWDISDPTNPVAVGQEVSEQFALAVISEGSTGWLGDWSIMGEWALTPGAPDMAVSNTLVQLPEDGGSTELTLTNFGEGSLEISGATSAEGVLIETKRTTLASGQSTTMRLTWSGGDLDSTICLASNDPDEPTREIAVVGGENGSYLGRPAPDFALQDLDGNTHQLSEQLGKPVVLAYFATW